MTPCEALYQLELYKFKTEDRLEQIAKLSTLIELCELVTFKEDLPSPKVMLFDMFIKLNIEAFELIVKIYKIIDKIQDYEK